MKSIIAALAELAGGRIEAEEEPEPIRRTHIWDRNSPGARELHARQRRAVARFKEARGRTRYHAKTYKWAGLAKGPGGPGRDVAPGRTVLDRIVRAMEPGAWYALVDLQHLAGLTYRERLGVRIFSKGYLTRQPNPEYKTAVARTHPNYRRLPQHLYTLTDVGLLRRRFLLGLDLGRKTENSEDVP